MFQKIGQKQNKKEQRDWEPKSWDDVWTKVAQKFLTEDGRRSLQSMQLLWKAVGECCCHLWIQNTSLQNQDIYFGRFFSSLNSQARHI